MDMKSLTKFRYVFIALLMTGTLVSCNEEFPNILKEDYGAAVAPQSLSKVLVIVTDGVRGNTLADLEPDNFRVIARNAMFTYSSMADYKSVSYTKEIGLANIITGVTSDAHNVHGSDLSDIDFSTAPSIFERLGQNYDGFTAEAYTTSADVKAHLLKDVQHVEVLVDDDQVVAATKASILESESSLIFTHLTNAYEVGEANSYESTDPAYEQAVLKVDVQVGEIIETIKAREKFRDEKWLVVITSSVGGQTTVVDPDDRTYFADGERNVFTYFYSPSFTRRYLAKPSTSSIPFEGNALMFKYGELGVNSASARLSDVSKLNFGANESFSFTLFMKTNAAMASYPIIMSKKNALNTGEGFQLVAAGQTFEYYHQGCSKIVTADIGDGKWHSITVTVDKSNTSDNQTKIYTDGVLSAQTPSGTSSLQSTYNFILGKNPRETGFDGGSYSMGNVQFYDRALTEAEVAEYSGLTYVTPDDSPLYGNLLAYWPGYDNVGTRTITDVTGKAGNLSVVNDLSWTSFSEVVPHFKAPVDERLYLGVPNLVDIPFFIYQWFGVLPYQSWALEGQSWTPPYAVLEY